MSFVLAWKLKVFKDDLKVWNKQEFGDVGLKRLLADIISLDAKEGHEGLSQEEKTCSESRIGNSHNQRKFHGVKSLEPCS